MIWGNGDELPMLQQRLIDENIPNVTFKGRVDKKYIPYIVSRADVNYIHGDRLPLFRYGISPNKLFDYFAAEKPVLMDMKAEYNPAETFECCLTSETVDELVNNINTFAKMPPQEYQEFCRRSADAAVAYDFKTLTQKLVEIVRG